MEEERSRFEKWWTTELPGKSWTSADIDNMELAWRAALEDRQEAAPACPVCGAEMVEQNTRCVVCHTQKTPMRQPPGVPSEATTKEMPECELCGATKPAHAKSNHVFMPPVVPSEATPSKENENAPTLRIDKLIQRAYDIEEEMMTVSLEEWQFLCEYYGAPVTAVSMKFAGKTILKKLAPEVQGTPKFLGHEIRQAIQWRIDDMEEGDWESYEKWKRHAFNAYRDLVATEQESSSLKLLLSAIQKGVVEFGYDRGVRILLFRGTPYKIFSVELDSSGIPVLTPEIVEALKVAQ